MEHEESTIREESTEAQPSGTFGAQLREARRAAGITQAQVGEFLGVGKAAVSNWESGRNEPGVEQLRTLCKRLNCSADDLLGIAANDEQKARA